MKNLIIKGITNPTLIYGIRCLLGFLVGYSLYIKYVEYELFWGLLSIILVISPEEKDSRKLSMDRVKSNVIGCTVALICIYLNPGDTALMVAIGIIITIIVSKLFKMLNYARVAIVALLIIMIEPHQTSLFLTPFFRFLIVAGGCLIGLFMVVTTSYILNILRDKFLPEE